MIDESGMLFVSEPQQLVGGDPTLVRFSAGRMRQLAGELDEAAFGMSRLDTAHWQGQAADAFRARFDSQPTMWRDASDAFGKAAGALEMYATAMVDGQARSAQAIRMFRESLQVTEQAKAAYDANLKAMAAGPHAVAVLTNPPPFDDPGQPLREQAVALANQAITDTQAVGDHAAAMVRAATEKAPPKPSFWDQVGNTFAAVAGDTIAAGEWTYDHVAAPVVNTAYKTGKAMIDDPGDTLQMVEGMLMMGGGIDMTGGGFVLDATGVGIPAGLATSAAGVGIAGAGAGLAANGARGLANQIDQEPNIMHEMSEDGHAAADNGASAATRVGRRGSPVKVPRGTNEPAVINGRSYGGHALDEMQSEGFTPSVVDDAIDHGQVTVGSSGRIGYYSRANNVTVVTEPDGKIVTVTSGKVKIR